MIEWKWGYRSHACRCFICFIFVSGAGGRGAIIQVSLEMAVRVLTIVLHWCPPMKRHAYMRAIEKTAALLTSRGHVTGVEVGRCHRVQHLCAQRRHPPRHTTGYNRNHEKSRHRVFAELDLSQPSKSPIPLVNGHSINAILGQKRAIGTFWDV